MEIKIKKKVLFVSSNAKSLYSFRGDLIKKIKKKGYQVSAIIPEPLSSDESELSKLNIKIFEIKLTNNRIKLFSEFFAFLKILFIIKNLKPDKIIAYTLKPIVFSGIANFFLKNKIEFYPIFTGLGSVFNSKEFKIILLSKFIKFLLIISLNKSKTIIFQNQDNYDYFNKNIIKISNFRIVLGSGVNMESFKYFKNNNKKMIFTMISRILKDKGVIEFIEAANIIKKKYPNVLFYLLGGIGKSFNSISMKELKQKIKNNSVKYFGNIDSKDDIYKFLKETSVLILPSYHEGIPRSILEAMSVGRPIITTNAVGCKETVTEGLNGFKVPVKNISKLVEKINYFICNSEKINKMGQESNKIVKSKFEINKINQEYLNVFEI
jgi:glycosyltransferase involved in cell wall biosynthesis